MRREIMEAERMDNIFQGDNIGILREEDECGQ